VSGDEWTEMKLKQQNGVALLAVLWLATALSAMALATSYLVRTEVEAATNRIEGEQMRFLARGGIEAAVDSMLRVGANVNSRGETAQPEFVNGQRWLAYDFPGGRCAVEVIPENAKLDVNQAPLEQLAALFGALGLDPIESTELARAIEDWRSPRVSDEPNAFDAYYASLPEPYRGRHAALEQLEELLPVRGMSRELFFGRIERTEQGTWLRWPPLADLLTVASTGGAVNLNYAAREVLESLPGWDAATAARIVEVREVTPFSSPQGIENLVPRASGASVTTAPSPWYMLTATCMHPETSARRSVRAMVEIGSALPLGYRVTGWWEDWPYAHELPPAVEQATASRTGGRG
jgi:general secretion pathway protein K